MAMRMVSPLLLMVNRQRLSKTRYFFVSFLLWFEDNLFFFFCWDDKKEHTQHKNSDKRYETIKPFLLGREMVFLIGEMSFLKSDLASVMLHVICWKDRESVGLEEKKGEKELVGWLVGKGRLVYFGFRSNEKRASPSNQQQQQSQRKEK